MLCSSVELGKSLAHAIKNFGKRQKPARLQIYDSRIGPMALGRRGFEATLLLIVGLQPTHITYKDTVVGIVDLSRGRRGTKSLCQWRKIAYGRSVADAALS